MDLIIQKSVELGVSAIVPLLTDRTIVRLNAREAEAKRQKWQRIALEACKQCGQNTLPEVAAPVPFAEWLRRGAPEGLNVIASLVPGVRPVRDVLEEARSPLRAECCPAGGAGGRLYGPGDGHGAGGWILPRYAWPHRPPGGDGRLLRAGRHAVRPGLSFSRYAFPCSRISFSTGPAPWWMTWL